MSDVNRPTEVNTIPVYIGFDHRQPISFSVLVTSLIEFSSRPLQIMPLVLQTLPIENFSLTPFTFTRFLVPWLCGYKGWAIFMDCDFLAQDDIGKLWDLRDNSNAVMVAEMPAREQNFEKASMILFNCAHPDNARLTPEWVGERKSTLIDWTDAVGTVAKEWNHLVGYSQPNADAALIHFTQGVPAYPETTMCEYADAWKRSARMSAATMPWHSLMGNSIHAKQVAGKVVPKLYPADQAPPDTAHDIPENASG